MAWRPSSAVQRPTQLSQAPSPLPNIPWIRRWYEGRLSSVSRPTSNEVWARLVRRPRLLVEVAPQPVGDVFVGEPLLGDLEVAVEESSCLHLELVEQAAVEGGDLRRGRRRLVDHGAPRVGVVGGARLERRAAR